MCEWSVWGVPSTITHQDWVFIIQAGSAAEAGFELLIPLSLPAKCWEGRHVPPHPASWQL